jgi:hypothetical protein
VKPLYTAADLEGKKIDQLPGLFPFTRGPYATMYTQKPWTIRQYAGMMAIWFVELWGSYWVINCHNLWRVNICGLYCSVEMPTHFVASEIH